jgi:hypothetical protein
VTREHGRGTVVRGDDGEGTPINAPVLTWGTAPAGIAALLSVNPDTFGDQGGDGVADGGPG